MGASHGVGDGDVILIGNEVLSSDVEVWESRSQRREEMLESRWPWPLIWGWVVIDHILGKNSRQLVEIASAHSFAQAFLRGNIVFSRHAESSVCSIRVSSSCTCDDQQRLRPCERGVASRKHATAHALEGALIRASLEQPTSGERRPNRHSVGTVAEECPAQGIMTCSTASRPPIPVRDGCVLVVGRHSAVRTTPPSTTQRDSRRKGRRMAPDDQPQHLATTETGTSTLVVATGVFDLLHVGHLRFLEAARSLGDVLIVGVEDDERVRRWKGTQRPIQTLTDRCDLLAALRVVDRVFTISGERVDPAYYADLLRPLGVRYLAVTADDPFLEEKRRAMHDIGVELRVVVPRIENYSTTRLVRLLGLP